MTIGKETWITRESARESRVRVQKVGVVLALLVYAVSLGLPAMEYTPAGSAGVIRVPGFTCAAISKPHYASNVLFFLAPLFCWMARQCRRAVGPMFLTLLAVASLVFVSLTPKFPGVAKTAFAASDVTFLHGFYVWAVAHAIMTVALSVPVWGGKVEIEDLSGELERLEGKWTGHPGGPTTAAA
jgi:hypothetical protein